MGNRTKSVDKSGTVSGQLFVGMQPIQLAIEQHAFGITGYILVGEVHLEVAFKGTVSDKVTLNRRTTETSFSKLSRLSGKFRFGVAEFYYRLLENLHISFIAKIGYESALFSAQ